jgi:23S rRNA pseudouridine1911/1915/1917 synthase
VYGQARLKADLGLERQFLHSYWLVFTHPVTGEELTFVDPLPEDLASRMASIAPDSSGRTAAGDEVFALLEGNSA